MINAIHSDIRTHIGQEYAFKGVIELLLVTKLVHYQQKGWGLNNDNDYDNGDLIMGSQKY